MAVLGVVAVGMMLVMRNKRAATANLTPPPQASARPSGVLRAIPNVQARRSVIPPGIKGLLIIDPDPSGVDLARGTARGASFEAFRALVNEGRIWKSVEPSYASVHLRLTAQDYVLDHFTDTPFSTHANGTAYLDDTNAFVWLLSSKGDAIVLKVNVDHGQFSLWPVHGRLSDDPYVTMPLTLDGHAMGKHPPRL